MQVLTRPAPRLWPEQNTLVGGVPPLMLSTTLLQTRQQNVLFNPICQSFA